MREIITENEQNVALNSGGGSLPCLNSNISNESDNLSTQQRKTAFILKASVEGLANKFGIENLGFLTLTFPDHVIDPKEAQRRLNSLITRVIKQRYGEYLGVMERQKSGRIHYHLLVVVGSDIKTGANFDEFRNCNYRSAPPGLRGEWAFWRLTAKKYGFGRTELLPIKSNIEAIAKYVGKYIAKHIENRTSDDHGVRLVRYSRGARYGTTRFMFHSDGATLWRQKIAVFAQIVANEHPDRCIRDLLDLTAVLGSSWAYRHREFILNLPV